MQLVQMPATSLVPGMFVAELDRPWLGTPFALQGFVVRNDDDVEFVAQHCAYVYIDQDYKGAPIYLPLAAPKPKAGVANNSTLRIRDEFQQTKVTFESAAVVLDRAFSALRKGRHADMNSVQEAVTPLIDGVFRNKEAVAALVRMKEKGDYLYYHGIAMAVWAAIIGRQLGLGRTPLMKLVTGCAMADIGMTHLPEGMLNKVGPLNATELELIRRHPEIGAAAVRTNGNADFETLAIIESHQERFDGSGYPRGLKGAQIPLVARIAGLVDAYDAMITERPWAPARSSFEATQELIDVKDVLFQGALIEQFIQAIGVFPTGALVELNTGEVGIVVRQNASRRLKPEIVIVLDDEKVRLDKLLVCDLGAEVIAGELGGGRWIARELKRGAYGLVSEDYFV